jgi:hypothetical protein
VNQNGQFESNELVYDQGAASVGPVSGTFTVPANTVEGLSRIRVQMAYQGFGASALPNNCGSYQSGETEDYCVTIKAANVSIENFEQVLVSMHPNPTSGTLNIVSNAGSALSIQVMSLSGQVVAKHNMNGASLAIDLSALSDGVYMVYALTEAGTVVQVQKLIVAKQ